jgi:hypothetical protein
MLPKALSATTIHRVCRKVTMTPLCLLLVVTRMVEVIKQTVYNPSELKNNPRAIRKDRMNGVRDRDYRRKKPIQRQRLSRLPNEAAR